MSSLTGEEADFSKRTPVYITVQLETRGQIGCEIGSGGTLGGLLRIQGACRELAVSLKKTISCAYIAIEE